MRIDQNGSSDPSSYIYSDYVFKFNIGNFSPEVSKLKRMANKVKDGGRFIIAACYIGLGKSGVDFGQVKEGSWR